MLYAKVERKPREGYSLVTKPNIYSKKSHLKSRNKMNVLAEVLTTWISQAPCKNIHLICALDGDISSILYALRDNVSCLGVFSSLIFF